MVSKHQRENRLTMNAIASAYTTDRIRRILSMLLLLVFATGSVALAADEDETGDPDAVGHTADGYYYTIPWFKDGGKVVNVELPRLMLVKKDAGGFRFDVFGSSHSAIEYGGYQVLNEEGEAFSAAKVEEFMADAHHPYLYYPIKPADGSILIDFSITRQILFVFVSALILLIVVMRLAGRYKRGIGRDEAPRGTWQNMMEVMISFIRDDVAKVAIGPKYERYVPYLLTLFFFILLGNLLGLVPWGVTATSNIMVTATLAVLTFLITQFSGTKDYWKHIFWPPGVAVPIKFILIPVEILGIFTKPLALAFRLFGNMASGHLAIVSILGLIFITTAKLGTGAGIVFVVISLLIVIFVFLLKVFVGFVQAYIFVMLSAVFIGMAAEEHHHDDHAHDHGDAHHHGTEGVAGAQALDGASGNGAMTTEPSLANA